MTENARALQSAHIRQRIGEEWNHLSNEQQDALLPIDNLWWQLEHVISRSGGEEVLQEYAPFSYPLVTRILDVLLDETGSTLRAEAEAQGEVDPAFRATTTALVAMLFELIQKLETTISLIPADET